MSTADQASAVLDDASRPASGVGASSGGPPERGSLESPYATTELVPLFYGELRRIASEAAAKKSPVERQRSPATPAMIRTTASCVREVTWSE